MRDNHRRAGSRSRRGVHKLARWVPTPYDAYAEAVALVGGGAYLHGESVLATK